MRSTVSGDDSSVQIKLAENGSVEVTLNCNINFDMSSLTALINTVGSETAPQFVFKPKIRFNGTELADTNSIHFSSQLPTPNKLLTTQAKPHIVSISTSFSAQNIQTEISNILELLGVQVRVSYNDFVEKLSNPDSAFNQSGGTVNVILLRSVDIITQQNIKENYDFLLEKITLHKEKTSTPLIIILTESNPSVTELSIEQLKAAETYFIEKLQAAKLAHIFTYEQIQKYYPTKNIHNYNGEKEGHLPYSSQYYHSIALTVSRICSSHIIKQKKVIVLDCDNTLWKGVVSEEGYDKVIVDSYRKQLQNFLLEKSRKGFLLCLCSKNDESDVFEVFEHNPSMILKKSDLTAWEINWKNKSRNIQSLAQKLNLGMDSFIFIDDLASECLEVSSHHPEVLALQLPEKDELIPYFLNGLWSLDKYNEATPADLERKSFYRQNVKRKEIKHSQPNFDSYLQKLELKVEFDKVRDIHLDRILQLMKRTNQFNLHKQEKDFNESYITPFKLEGCSYVIKMKDKFMGDFMIVGVFLAKPDQENFIIDTFLLSCRGLSKGIEYRALKKMQQIAEKQFCKSVIIKFQRTSKNTPALKFLDSIAQEPSKNEGGIELYQIQLDSIEQLRLKETSTKEKRVRFFGEHEIPTEITFLKAIVHRAITQKRNTESNTSLDKEIETDEVKFKILLICKKNDIDLNDNGTSLVSAGADSISVLQIASEIFEELSVLIEYTDLLEENCNLEKISTMVKLKLNTSTTSITLQKERCITDFPTSRSQSRLWQEYKINRNGRKYNIFAVFAFKEKINPTRLEESLVAIFEKEEIFRTKIINVNGQLRQRIIPLEEFVFKLKKYGGTEFSKKNIREWADNIAQTKFDLARAPLFRIELAQAEKTSYLAICIDHMISDGESLTRFITMINESYNNRRRSLNMEIAGPQNPQFIDFSTWEDEKIKPRIQKHKTFWKKQLGGAKQVNLATKDYVKDKDGKRFYFELDSALTDSLIELSNQLQITLYNTLLSIYMLLLAKHADQKDITVTSPISGRHYPNVKNTLGFFVNLILVRRTIPNDINFYEYLIENRKILLNIFRHQDYPFSQMLGMMDGDGDIGQIPYGFSLQNYSSSTLTLGKEQGKRVFADNESVLYDSSDEPRLGNLCFYMRQEGQKISALVEYNLEKFDSFFIQNLVDRFIILANQLIKNPKAPILRHSFLTKQEIQLFQPEKIKNSPQESSSSLISKFSKMVEKYPNEIAAQYAKIKLTYAELDALSTKLARILNSKLILEIEDRVAFCLPRNHLEAITILAIIKLGCAYVPIDPKNPKERIEFILQDTDAKIFLTSNEFSLQINTACNQLIVSDLLDTAQKPPGEAFSQELTGDSLAYIMYTSGSTSTPKGVMIEHSSIIRLVIDANYITITQNDNIAQLANSAFDASTLEFWGAVLNGACLCYSEKPLPMMTDTLSKFLLQHKISILWLTSALFEKYALDTPEIFGQLDYLLSGGDVLNPKAVNAIVNCKQKPTHLINGYGPSENTTFTTTLEITKPYTSPIPIGKPINGTEIYILDSKLQCVPIGIVGEIYTSGLGVARGYLNKTAATKKNFIVVKIFGEYKRLYKTSDLGFWQRDGNLQFAGRTDSELKIHGYRVSIKEIENTILTHPNVQQVAIIVSHKEKNATRMKQLSAYIVLNGMDNIDNIIKFIRLKLPLSMMPHRFISIKQLPITNNGKVDRKKLLQLNKPEIHSIENSLYLIDQILFEILSDNIISTGIFSCEDDFFKIGGDSIAAVRVSEQIQRRFSINFSTDAFSCHSTINEIIAYIEQQLLEKHTASKNIFLTLNKGNPTLFDPIILIHPVGGNVLIYKNFCDNLNSEQPCYAITDPSLTVGKVVFRTIPEIANYYLSVIKGQKLGSKSFHLVGHSFGGMVALEMAIQCSQQKIEGYKIHSVISFDSWIVSKMPQESRETLKEYLLKSYNYKEELSDTTQGELLHALFKQRQDIGFAYTPTGLITARIILFKADNPFSKIIKVSHKTNFLGDHTSKCVVFNINATHQSILDPEQAKKITLHLKAVLKKKPQENPHRVFQTRPKNKCPLRRSSVGQISELPYKSQN